MTAKITWTNETRKLSELKPWTRNPRQIDKASAKFDPNFILDLTLRFFY